MDSLVTTEWLANALGAGGPRVVDATWVMPGDGRDPATEFAEVHLPGAVFMDLAEIADTRSPLPNMLPMPERFASRMQALGIGDRCDIVVYDHSPYHSAARAWWMLRTFGARSVAILDGGLDRWQSEGRPVVGGPVRAVPKLFTVTADFAGVRTLDQMLGNLSNRTEQVVDARSAPRFAGTERDPRPGIAPGHIPGSHNLPYSQLFDGNGGWKTGSALRAAFVDAGIDPERPVITTCGSGMTAAVLAFGLHLLGNDAALYDGSWSEWGTDPATLKATGAA